MKLDKYVSDFFQVPFRKKRLIAVFLSLLILPAISFAADDIQQSDIKDVKEILKQAEKLTRKGEFSEAEKILRRALATFPRHKTVKLDLAYLLLKQKQLRPAYDLALEVAKDDPKNSYAFAILGAAYLTAGNFSEAKILLLNAINLNRKEALAWAGLGMLDFYENRIFTGLENLRAAVYYDSKEPDFVFVYAQIAARAEEYKEAAYAYERFLQISPRTDTERRDRIKGLIRFLRFLGNQQSLYDLGGKENIVVPVTLMNDRPIIELKINGNNQIAQIRSRYGFGHFGNFAKNRPRIKYKIGCQRRFSPRYRRRRQIRDRLWIFEKSGDRRCCESRTCRFIFVNFTTKTRMLTATSVCP